MCIRDSFKGGPGRLAVALLKRPAGGVRAPRDRFFRRGVAAAAAAAPRAAFERAARAGLPDGRLHHGRRAGSAAGAGAAARTDAAAAAARPVPRAPRGLRGEATQWLYGSQTRRVAATQVLLLVYSYRSEAVQQPQSLLL